MLKHGPKTACGGNTRKRACNPVEFYGEVRMSPRNLAASGDQPLLDKRPEIGYANDCSQSESHEPGG